MIDDQSCSAFCHILTPCVLTVSHNSAVDKYFGRSKAITSMLVQIEKLTPSSCIGYLLGLSRLPLDHADVTANSKHPLNCAKENLLHSHATLFITE